MRGINHADDFGWAAVSRKGPSGGGGNTSTVTQNSAPPPNMLAGLDTALQSGQAVAAQPYQQYQGQLQADFSPQQMQAFNLIGSSPGIAAPYINAAAQHYDAATAPLIPTIAPWIGAASDYYSQVGGTDLQGATSPYTDEAAARFRTAGNSDLFGAIDPWQQAAAQGFGGIQGAIAPWQQSAASSFGGMTGAAAPYQQSAANSFGSMQSAIAPWQQAAAAGYGASSQQLTPEKYSSAAINSYMSPYLQSVVNATQAQFNDQNAQAANRLQGNAASAGALGGDRAGVAQGVLAGQQQTAQAPVIAGLYNQGFGQAQNEFNTQQQIGLTAQQQTAALRQQAAAGLAGLGNQSLQALQAQGSGMAGLGAQAANILQGQGAGMAGLGNQSLAAQQAAAQGYAGLGAQSLAAAQGQGQLQNAAGQGLLAAGNQSLTAAQQQAMLRAQAAQGMTTVGNQALSANQANAYLNSQAGAGLGQLGQMALNSNLQSANALAGAGALQQQQAQQGLNIPFSQFQAQQAYPFQTSAWLSGLTGQLSNAAGGTGSTTSPGPSPFSQVAGGLLGAAGTAGMLFGQNGAFPNAFSGGGGGGFAGDLSGYGQTAADYSFPSNFGFGGSRDGGAIPHRAPGGSVGSGGLVVPGGGDFGLPGSDVPLADVNLTPDVSMSFVPEPPKPGMPSQGKTSTTTGGSGSGGNPVGQTIGTLGSLAGLAKLAMLLNRGGEVPHRAGGGPITVIAPTSDKTGFAVPQMQVDPGLGRVDTMETPAKGVQQYLRQQARGQMPPDLTPHSFAGQIGQPPPPPAAAPPIDPGLAGIPGMPGEPPPMMMNPFFFGAPGGGPIPAVSPTPDNNASTGGQARGGAIDGYAAGGVPGVSMGMMVPPWTRGAMRSMGQPAPTAGFLGGHTPGRADSIKGMPAAGSHVIPADVLSGLGEGNSLAGARAMHLALNTGPGGIPLPRAGSRGPRPRLSGRAPGGGVDDEDGYPALGGAAGPMPAIPDYVPPPTPPPAATPSQPSQDDGVVSGSPLLGPMPGLQGSRGNPLLAPPTERESRRLDEFEARESGGKNIHTNLLNPDGTPSTASGHYQMVDPTWRENARLAGVDITKYPTAESAPKPLQKMVALVLYRREGDRPWAASDPNRHGDGAQAGLASFATNADADQGLAAPPMVPRHDYPRTEVHKADPWSAIAEAGFTMMAGRSPYAAQNIGAGLATGIKSYRSDQKEAEALSARVDDARARLAESQAYHQDTVGARYNIAGQRSADRQSQIDNQMKIAQLRIAERQARASERGAGHLSSAELEQTQIDQLMKPVEQGGMGMNRGEAIQAAKGQIGRSEDRERRTDAAVAGMDLRRKAYEETVKQHGITNDRAAQAAIDRQIKNMSDQAIRIYVDSKHPMSGKFMKTPEQAEAEAASMRPAAPAVPGGSLTDPFGMRHLVPATP